MRRLMPSGPCAFSLSAAIRQATQRPLSDLEAIADVLNATPPIDRETFSELATPALSRRPSLYAMGWAPGVSDDERACFEAGMRAEAFANTTITQVGDARVRPLTDLLPDRDTAPTGGSTAVAVRECE
jgi:hypothetical protein